MAKDQLTISVCFELINDKMRPTCIHIYITKYTYMCTQPEIHTSFKDQILTKTLLNIIFLDTKISTQQK